MTEYQQLDSQLVARLCLYPMSTFVPLGFNGTKITHAGMLTLDETEASLNISKDSIVHLRPDKLPEEALSLSMLSLTPLCLGQSNVGWYISFPAMHVNVGRNYIRVQRARAQLSKKDTPELSILLRSLLVMEVPDVMSVVLSTAVRDMRT